MYSHQIEFRVRYAETDKMGYVHHGNYPTYYEMARIEAFRALGIDYSQMETDGIMMPVRTLNSRYYKAAGYDELLRIKSFVKELPKATIIFSYEIYNQKNELINTGETELVFITTLTRKPIKAPQNILEKLSPYFKE